MSIVAAQAEPFRCFGNVLIEPHAAIDDTDVYDVIIVCDLYTPITTAPRGRFAREAAWLRRMHARGCAHRVGLHGIACCSPKPACSRAARAPGTGPTPTCSARSTRGVTFDAAAILVLGDRGATASSPPGA